jgi:DNA-binding NarL/FixJ family response regulator
VLLPWELILLVYMVKKMNEFYLLQPGLLTQSRPLEKVYRITEREREIIALICRGKTNRDIEDALFISLQTVKNHIHNLFKKLNVKNRVELVNFIRVQASSGGPQSPESKSVRSLLE